MAGIALNYLGEGRICDGSQSRLRLDGEFLGSAALFTVDRTLSHPPRPFNGIEVNTLGQSMKIRV
jgi:hypothetical protein